MLKNTKDAIWYIGPNVFWNGEAFLSYNRILQKASYPVSLKLMLANEKYAQPWLWGTGVSSHNTAVISTHSSPMACPPDLSWSGPVTRELLGNLYTAGKNVPCFHRTAVCWPHCLGMVRMQEHSLWAMHGGLRELRVEGDVTGAEHTGAGVLVVVAWGKQNKR